jgi:hypothetical protein
MARLLNYLIRDIDPELWAKVKARAKSDGLSVRVVLFLLVKSYADGKILVGAAPRKSSR